MDIDVPEQLICVYVHVYTHRHIASHQMIREYSFKIFPFTIIQIEILSKYFDCFS